MANQHPVVEIVRLFQKEDGLPHRTHKFQAKNGICYLRRGEPFHVAIKFLSNFDPRFHRLQFYFYTGYRDRSLYTSSDIIRVLEPTETHTWPPSPNEWGAKRVYTNRDKVAVEVVAPTWVPVGSWHLEVRTVLVGSPGIESYMVFYKGIIYFLFNPWNPEDDTHMPDNNQLDQYVLNDVGHIWLMYNALMWDFGQFEDCMLPAFELLMKQDGLPRSRRGDPVTIARAISRIVNYGMNRAGLMIGNWTGKYDGGTSPMDWRGSAGIMQKYLNSGGAPVKYAQCWVFAGLTVTICRALGLPARLVTTVGSGQDHDGSFTIDDIYTDQLESDKKEGMWNYHCWIDAWMRRRDIGKNEYHGWQAVDGTPQHISNYHYQLGPVPVHAIKLGDVNVPYDAPYVYCEVNGDYVRWLKNRDGTLRPIDLDTKKITTAIFTDDPYSTHIPKMFSIMDQYKYPEGSAMERQAMYRAIASNPHYERRRREMEAHIQSNDVFFEGVHRSYVKFGENIDLTFKITNNSNQVRTMQYELLLDVVDHANNFINWVKVTQRSTLTVNPNERQIRSMRVSSQEYAYKLIANSLLRYRIKCWVTETGQPWLYDGRIYITYPKLAVHLSDAPSVLQPLYAHFNFDEPVNDKLTNCKLMIGGSCFGGDLPEISLNDVPSGVVFAHRILVQPMRSGLQKMTVKFTSSEIPKVDTWIEVDVRGVSIGRSDRVLNFKEHMSEIIENAFIDKTILS